MPSRDTIAFRAGRRLASVRAFLMQQRAQQSFDLRLALRNILAVEDPEAEWADGLLEADGSKALVMLYRDGSRLRISPDLSPTIIPTGEASDF